MAKSANQKIKILYIMDMLISGTDEDKGVSMSEILSMLEANGISAERKSIYDDFNVLKEYGLDILSRKGKTTEYFIASRDFELPELKLLVDAVQSSKFITQKKSMELIKKLESLTSRNQAKSLQRQVYVTNRIKTQNESIYYNVDTLHLAITEKKKVSFLYFDYDAEKERVYRKNKGKYIVNPIGLSWNEENYYLIAYSEKYNDFTHYRVDRMTNISLLEEKQTINEVTKDFNVAEYCKNIFGMFDGEDVNVQFIANNALINTMLDRFGKDVPMYRNDENSVRIITKISSAATFFGWLAQFGDSIRIESPKKLREEYVAFLRKTIEVNER